MSTEGLVPRYHQMADLPPPGNARRRLLRQLGMAICREDFTDEELAQRGIAVETQDDAPRPED